MSGPDGPQHSTCSTAVEQIPAIITITGDRNMKLRQYELSEDDWVIARQLRDVLKVCSYVIQ
jgi:protein-disulfide isomerase